MAQVLPFPLARRRDLVRRQASFYTDQRPYAAETNLARQLQVQADTLLRKGVAPEVVAAEVECLKGAIRAEVWRQAEAELDDRELRDAPASYARVGRVASPARQCSPRARPSGA